MKKNTLIFLVFFLLSCFLLPAEVFSGLGIYAACGTYNIVKFDDVDSSYPYYEDICFLKKNQLAEGFLEEDDNGNKVVINEYRPDTNLTRAEFAKMITTAYSKDELLKESVKKDCFFTTKNEKNIRTFFDIIPGDLEEVTAQKIQDKKKYWYMKRMCYAKQEGIMIGVRDDKCYKDKSGNEEPCYRGLPNSDIVFREALKMTMVAFGYKGECRKDRYDKEWSDRFLYSIITNNIIDDFTVSFEKSGDFGAIDRGYAAYLIKNIVDKKGRLNVCENIIGTPSQVGISGANVRSSPYKRDDDKSTTEEDESEFNKIAYIKPHDNVTVIKDEIKIRKSKRSDDFNKKWKLIDTGDRIGFIHSSTIGDNNITLGSLVFPFQDRSKDWEICQGYNTTKITHKDKFIYSLDFVYGTGHAVGTYGCGKSKLNNDSKNKLVVAPIAGKIVKNDGYPPELVCLQLNNVVLNGHEQEINSIMIGHIANDENRAKVNDEVLQGNTIGKLCGAGECKADGKYSHLHLSVYTSNNCSGVSIPIGTIFGEGYDFSSDNSDYQWYGTKISSFAY